MAASQLIRGPQPFTRPHAGNQEGPPPPGVTRRPTPSDTLRRSRYGAVSLAATGLPHGVTATFNPGAPTGATSTLTLAASAGATLGAATVQVQGTGDGVGGRTASLQLTVAPVGVGGAGNVTWSFCDGAGPPLWFAVRDGTGPWTRVEANAGGDYQFPVNGDRGTLAWVEDEPGITQTQVNFFSREELFLISSDPCRGAQGDKTVNGTVVGLTPTQTAVVSLGSSPASVAGTGGASSSFTLERVIDGPRTWWPPSPNLISRRPPWYRPVASSAGG